nr:MAG TPA: hypothetical protein [Caudoviricetes sp.]
MIRIGRKERKRTHIKYPIAPRQYELRIDSTSR